MQSGLLNWETATAAHANNFIGKVLQLFAELHKTLAAKIRVNEFILTSKRTTDKKISDTD